MNTEHRNRLDIAIDQVTARMVQVRDDDDLAVRIAASLPERSARFRWLIPQFAVITAFAIAAVVWTTRDPAPPSMLPSCDVARMVGVPNTVAAIAPGTIAPGTIAPGTIAPGTIAPGTVFGTLPLERMEPLEPLERLDHERSLPALAMSDVSPGELPATAALTLAPIDITDLPMTAESFPPR